MLLNLKIVEKINKFGFSISYIENESTRDFNRRMELNCPDEYIKAKSDIAPTDAQIKLCNDLVDCGASFHLKEPHLLSMNSADIFIKENYHLLRDPTPDSVRGQRLMNPFLGANKGFYSRNVPSDFNILNH